MCASLKCGCHRGHFDEADNALKHFVHGAVPADGKETSVAGFAGLYGNFYGRSALPCRPVLVLNAALLQHLFRLRPFRHRLSGTSIRIHDGIPYFFYRQHTAFSK